MSNFAKVQSMHAKFALSNTDGPTALTVEEHRFRIKAMWEELVEHMHSVFSDRVKRNEDFFGIDDMKLVVDKYIDKLELREDANNPHIMAEQFDSLIDLTVFAMGTAERQGFPFNEGFDRVMDANLKKRLATNSEESKRGFARDIVKPQGWTPPVLLDLVIPVKKGED